MPELLTKPAPDKERSHLDIQEVIPDVHADRDRRMGIVAIRYWDSWGKGIVPVHPEDDEAIEVASDELHEKIHDIKATYKQRVHDFTIKEGLSDRALRRLDAVDTVDVLATTEFLDFAAANYDSENHRVSLGFDGEIEGYEPDEHILSHELSHSITHTEERRQKLTQVFGEFGQKVVDEALTEHFTESLLRGNFNVIDPSERKQLSPEERKIYGLYREFLDTLLNGGLNKITIHDMYDTAYFTDFQTDDALDDERIASLLEQVTGSFPGFDVLQALQDIPDEHDDELRALIACMKTEGIQQPPRPKRRERVSAKVRGMLQAFPTSNTR